MNWDLSKLYAGFDDPAFSGDMAKLAEGIDAARAQIAALGEGPDEVARLRGAVERLRDLTDLRGKLEGMVSLTLSADSDCEAALGPRQRILELENELRMLESALVRHVGANPRIDALCEQDEVLKEHAVYFRKCGAAAAHLIDPALEPAVLQMQMTGGTAWARLRDELFAGLSIDVELDGETKTLPLSGVRALADDPRAEVRAAGYRAELGAYPRIETAMAACLNGIKGEALTLARMRNYDSVLDWALGKARMDRETLDALLTAIEESLPSFRRYFRAKAKLLGYEGGLKFQDLFAPVGEDSRSYTLDEARDVLLEVFGSHCPEIAEVMRRAFAERWIDAYPRPGKEGGAFCADVHMLKLSYVLTNFNGSLSSVSTLAHELGHAYHDKCLEDASALMCDVPMVLAETASTFNELLLSEHMLDLADGPRAEIPLLDQQIGDAAQVIVDIMSRYLFETEVVERRRDGALTARELCEIMRDAQLKTYGDGLDPDHLHPYMWACKPHYYFPDHHFYNVPYAFGMLFASGLHGKYREMGKDFWPMYRKLLRFSGAGTVREAAAAAGIDVTDPAFWRGALANFQKRIDKLEKSMETA